MKIFVFLLFISLSVNAKTVKYDLTATKGEVNLTGKATVDFALMLNGTIPGPTLEFTEGDDAEITVKNRLTDEEVSVHWHGILVPNEMDGVPYVTTPPILPGEQFTFKFRIRQNGTYWYHSHTNVQEQKGVYGAIVIHPKKPTISYDKDIVLVMSDWTDENPTQVLKNLKKDGDYYLYKKATVRSWLGALQNHALGTYIENEWTRMGGMDLSDVGYDAFLINGKREVQISDVKPGQRLRLRLINASASTYFYISMGQAPMKVISADGIDIEAINAKEILSGMAETHDLLFVVPENTNTELKITAQDGTGSASAWIGSGKKISAPERPLPDLYMAMNMDHSSHGGHEAHGTSHNDHSEHEHSAHSEHEGHQMPSIKTVETLSVNEIKSPVKTDFAKSIPAHEVKLELDGNMGRYVWFINDKPISEDRNIEIKQNEVVKFTMVNKTMMHHPMHLHGHFFRVLNQFGDNSPLKHTVDVSPHESKTIEFLANEPGEWMLHCHNLYHLKTGMARVVKYSSFTPSNEIMHFQKHDPHLHEHWYYYGSAEAATNHGQLYLRASQTRNQWELRAEGRNGSGRTLDAQDWELEGDLFYRRWMGQFFNLILGGTSFEKREYGVLGIGYTLPLLIQTDVLVEHTGGLRLDMEKRFQWTSKILTDVSLAWRPAHAKPIEYEVSLMYAPSWSWSAGLMLTDLSLGAGAEVKF